MSCSVLTAERLELLLRGALPDGDGQLLRTHLGGPCDDCLELLAGPAGERLLERIAGDGLTKAELDRVVTSAVAAAPRAPGRAGRPHWARRPVRAAALLAAAAAVLLVVRLAPPPGGREKGAPQAPSAELVPFAARTAAPDALRPFASGQPLGRGEVVLLRLRTSQPAFLYLVGSSRTQAPELLWSSLELSPRELPAGERELSRGGSVLSVDLRALGPEARTTLFACRQVHPAEQLLLAVGPGARATPPADCGVDVLRSEVAP